MNSALQEVMFGHDFPYIESYTKTDVAPGADPMVINVPAGSVAGDLLLTVAGYSDDHDLAAPAGWTRIAQTTSSVEDQGIHIYYRVCDGTSTDTTAMSISTGGDTNSGSGGIVMRIRRHGHTNTAGQGPAVGTIVNATTTTPNPPLCTPTWPPGPTLWIACFEVTPARAETTPPVGWFHGTSLITGTLANVEECTIQIAYLPYNISALDPPAFGAITSSECMAETIAVRYAGAHWGPSSSGG